MRDVPRAVLAIFALPLVAGCFDNATLGDTVNAYNIKGIAPAQSATLKPYWPSDSDGETANDTPTCYVVFAGEVASGIGALNVEIEWGDGATTTLKPQASGAKISETHKYDVPDEYTDFRVLIRPDNGQSPNKAACLGTSVDYTNCETEPPTTTEFVTDCTVANN